jgi:nucleoside-diphosphate-sugar epimerase
VTGGTGFIGGELVRQLRALHHDVVVLARDPSKGAALAALGATLHPGDVTDKASMRPGMAGADVVFHVAAWYKLGKREGRRAWQINVDGTRNVLELLDELHIPKGVYTSTIGIFSDTHGRIADESYRFAGPYYSEYERTKAAAHYEVALPMIERGLSLVIVMPGLVYGPGDTSGVRKMLVKYLERTLPMVPRGASQCWAHVEDVARGHILAWEKGRAGQSYIIAGPRHTFAEALAIAEKITGIPAPRRQLGPSTLKILAGMMKVVGAVVPLPDDYQYETLRTVAGTTYVADNSKARRELGYDPRPLETGLRQTLEHERALLPA